MSSVNDLRARNPWRLDQLIAYSGKAYRRSAPAKSVAAAHKLEASRGRRYCIGDVNSPLAKALAYLASCPFTDSFPALIEGYATVTQREIWDATDDALAARRAELEMIEHDLERDENRATYMHDDDACIEAHARKAAVHLELHAIIREQRERKSRA